MDNLQLNSKPQVLWVESTTDRYTRVDMRIDVKPWSEPGLMEPVPELVIGGDSVGRYLIAAEDWTFDETVRKIGVGPANVLAAEEFNDGTVSDDEPQGPEV